MHPPAMLVHRFAQIVGQVHLLREHDSRAGDVETKSDATAEASHEGVVTDVPPVALLEFFHRIVLVDKVNSCMTLRTRVHM